MPDFRDYIGVDFTSQFLQHYGKGHLNGGHSGRYPWGSGKNPKQRRVVAGVPIDRMSRTSTSDYWKEHYGKQFDEFYNSRTANSISELSRRRKSDDISELRENINNPEDESYKVGGRSYNCQNCSLAFEMVERGYDVSAKGKPNGSNVGDIEKYFKGGKMVNASSIEDLSALKRLSKNFEEASNAYWNANNVSKAELKRLEKANNDACEKFYDALDSYRKLAEESFVKECLSKGKDARGIVIVGWMDNEDPDIRTNSFHAMNYKVENGNVKIYDAQSSRSEKQNGEWQISDMIDGFDPREIYVMRTDNLEPNESICDAVYSSRRKSK